MTSWAQVGEAEGQKPSHVLGQSPLGASARPALAGRSLSTLSRPCGLAPLDSDNKEATRLPSRRQVRRWVQCSSEAGTTLYEQEGTQREPRELTPLDRDDIRATRMELFVGVQG